MYDMAAGKQWGDEERDQLEDQQKAPVVFNRIARTLNAIIGTQINNRQEVRYLPREQGDVAVNEVLTSAAEWARQECYAEDEESDAFEDMCTCGIGWTDTRMDYLSNPEGDIVIERIDPLEMYYDPSARKRNLSDAKWFLHLKSMSIDEFERQFPGVELSSLTDPWDGEGEDASKRNHVYPNEAYEHQQGAAASSKRTVRVGRYQWAEAETVYRVGPEAQEITAEQYKQYKPAIEAQGLKVLKAKKARWRQAFIAGGSLIGEVEDSPYPEGPTLRAMTYKRERNTNTWYGIVRAMVDPQKFGNKFFSQILDILNKGAKGGVMMEKDAVDDPEEVEEKWARPDSVMWLRPGALSGNKVLPKPVVTLPAGLDRLMTFSMDGVHEVTGINLELLGMANRQQAGVLEHQRKQAGVTIIAPLFDGLRRYRKEQGRVLLHFISEYISDGRLVRIVGGDTEKYVPLVKQTQGLGKYDVVVDEAPTSPNMKERVFGVLQELMPSIAKMGIPIPPEVLDYSPLPQSLTSKWKELIQSSGGNPEQIKQQMAQMQEQAQKLTQENAQLKDKSAQESAKLQMDQQKLQSEIAAEKERMAMEWEKLQMEMQVEREKLNLEREKANVSIQIDAERAQHDMATSQAKSEHERGLGEKKLIHDARLKGYDIPVIEDLIESVTRMGDEVNVLKQPRVRKRRVNVRRDEAGELVGADVEDFDG